MLLNDVRHPWFVDLLDGLISVLEADGRHVVLSGGGRLDRRMDESVLRGFLGLETDGFILADTQASSPAIAEIAASSPPSRWAGATSTCPGWTRWRTTTWPARRWPPAT